MKHFVYDIRKPQFGQVADSYTEAVNLAKRMSGNWTNDVSVIAGDRFNDRAPQLGLAICGTWHDWR